MNSYQPIAIVTGANRGLGKETCRQLAAQGYLVVVTARELSNAEQAVNEMGLENLLAAQLDVTSQESVAALFDLVAQRFGRVDVLVNNAAINYDIWQTALNVDLTTVQEAMDTNVYGAWRVVNAFMPLLKNEQAGPYRKCQQWCWRIR